jgi:hypothetical protein
MVTAALAAAAILVALGGSSAHAGHGCLVDQDCLACRWSAEGVALVPTPPALPAPEGIATLSPVAPEGTPGGVRTPGRSRGPPRG